MSERDTTAQKFFGIVDRIDGAKADHAREVYFAAGDKVLNLFIRDDMTLSEKRPDFIEEMAEYLVLMAAQYNFDPDDMQQMMREAEDRVADQYGLQTGRTS